MLFLICAVFFVGCSKKGGAEVTDIIMGDIYLSANRVTMPEITVKYDNGDEKILGADNFWFNGNYTYMQDNDIVVKPNAPFIFEDTLQISYRFNTQITKTIKVLKEYIPLDAILLSSANGKFLCPQGETLQLYLTFIPANASDKNVEYQIIQGKFLAEIDKMGVLSVNETATVGEQIKIKAVANHTNLPPDITDDADETDIIITVEKSYEVITVDKTTQTVYPPKKDGCAFYGYYSQKNGEGTKYFDYSGKKTENPPADTETILYAFWLDTSSVWERFDGDKWKDPVSGMIKIRNQRIINNSYTETITQSLEIAKLKEVGFSKIKIAVEIGVREYNDGTQGFYCYSGNGQDAEIWHEQFEHGKGVINSAWERHNFVSKNIDINQLAGDGSFWLRWTANGVGKNDWALGYTKIVVSVSV
jgi:hypothetical protein